MGVEVGDGDGGGAGGEGGGGVPLKVFSGKLIFMFKLTGHNVITLFTAVIYKYSQLASVGPCTTFTA